MATRSRTSFQKRQKELARQDRQRAKAERRLQRKLEKQAGATASGEPAAEDALEAEPHDEEETAE